VPPPGCDVSPAPPSPATWKIWQQRNVILPFTVKYLNHRFIKLNVRCLYFNMLYHSINYIDLTITGKRVYCFMLAIVILNVHLQNKCNYENTVLNQS